MGKLLCVISDKPVDGDLSFNFALDSSKEQNHPSGSRFGFAVLKNDENTFKILNEAFLANEWDKLEGATLFFLTRILIAHVSLDSSRIVSKNNYHLFGYKDWVFAHNGTINRERIRELLKEEYDKDYKSEPIDSEVFFRYLIQSIDEEGDAVHGIEKATREVIQDSSGANFLLSDGQKLYAYRNGSGLHYLLCNPNGPFHSDQAKTKAILKFKFQENQKVVVIASEPLNSDENWTELKDDSLLVVDLSLKLETYQFS